MISQMISAVNIRSLGILRERRGALRRSALLRTVEQRESSCAEHTRAARRGSCSAMLGAACAAQRTVARCAAQLMWASCSEQYRSEQSGAAQSCAQLAIALSATHRAAPRCVLRSCAEHNTPQRGVVEAGVEH